MEQTIMNGVAQYGLTGLMMAYLIYKDIVLNKALTDALSKFTIAINVLCGKKVEE